MKTLRPLKNRQVVLTRKSKLPVSLRKHRDEAKYVKEKKSGLAQKPLHKEEPIKQWRYWQLIYNKYPYSAAFKVHHLLIPKRVVSHKELNEFENRELTHILEELNKVYDCLLVNFERKQSIKKHFHMHLLTYIDSRKDLKL